MQTIDFREADSPYFESNIKLAPDECMSSDLMLVLEKSQEGLFHEYDWRLNDLTGGRPR